MNFSFSSLIRLLVVLVVGSTMLAVGLSRLTPPSPSLRTTRPTQYSNVNEFFFETLQNRTSRWLDRETGQMTEFRVEDGDVLETASVSPWVDEKNQRQVVGRWTTRIKDGPMSMSKDFGLARYSFPGGEALDHVSTEIIPVGPPCWFPGTVARVIFAAGDGMLYHYAFEPEPWATQSEEKPQRDHAPMPLTWRCAKPGNGNIFLADLCWPEDPRMGGCLVVSLREQAVDSSGLRNFSKTSLWWLKLNFAGTEIVDLGQLLIVDDPGRISDHRNPMVGTLPDGRLALAYLSQESKQIGWEVRVAPIDLDPDRHFPKALDSRSVRLAGKCLPARPTFSPDGRWLNAITGPDSKESVVTRLPLTGVFPPTH